MSLLNIVSPGRPLLVEALHSSPFIFHRSFNDLEYSHRNAKFFPSTGSLGCWLCCWCTIITTRNIVIAVHRHIELRILAADIHSRMSLALDYPPIAFHPASTAVFDNLVPAPG